MTASRYVLLLADIHANEEALKEVMKDARQRYSEHLPLHIWFLGDLFGRGPAPVSIWRKFLGYKPDVILAGNHDWAIWGRVQVISILDSTDDSACGLEEWAVILKHRAELVEVGLLDNADEPKSGEVFEYLAQLPVIVSPYPGIYLTHGGWEQSLSEFSGGSRDNLLFGYIKNAKDVSKTFDLWEWLVTHQDAAADLPIAGELSARPELIIVGHYHRRTLCYQHGRVLDWVYPVKLDYAYPLSPVAPTLISPGSVGFPREDHHDKRASYAILHLQGQQAQSVTFHAVPFNRDKVRQSMADKLYPPEVIKYLWTPGDEVLSSR